MKYEIKSDDIEPIQKKMEILLSRGLDLKPMMRTAGEIMRASAGRNFEAEGRPSRWKPLSSATKEIYSGKLLDEYSQTKGYQNAKRESTRKKRSQAHVQARLGGRKLLQGEGDLKKSIVIGEITSSSVKVGSSLPYARIHQLGGTIKPRRKKVLMIPLGGGKFMWLKKVTIPARPYLLFQSEDQTAIVRALDSYFLRSL
ncbi:hypothetical protein Sgly_0774 [Syntrophobotulus glycolicus DSM 8271]|uniref:Phage virion morphogenesis protein n=1 Tax=Syntrophobotulus glycolicus (strain DSM 8271 / FlGlyR) TaxID=645991 RepID=F0T167_SYNGF|nr:phage virion morphogenesis protein [Syntrophobotulus glycolicus]ADY55131.1 hypothetical protein Sgly_0774 [Syntrophobotulus glycolicus DSM 8271]